MVSPTLTLLNNPPSISEWATTSKQLIGWSIEPFPGVAMKVSYNQGARSVRRQKKDMTTLSPHDTSAFTQPFNIGHVYWVQTSYTRSCTLVNTFSHYKRSVAWRKDSCDKFDGQLNPCVLSTAATGDHFHH